MNSPHLEEALQKDMDRIRSRITDMGMLGERALRQCVDALPVRDRQKAYAVILRDLFIDESEREIDRLCLEFLVRRQPVAGPLRFAFAAIQITLQLERVGDYAEGIARQILKLAETDAPTPSDAFGKIADMSIVMLRDAVRAFTDEDEALAHNVIEREEAVDLLKRNLKDRLLDLHKAGQLSLEAFNALKSIANRFERVSDQARNIAVETLYFCTGRYAKHGNTDTFHILFVDDEGSSRALMAEALADAMAEPRFRFTGASMRPAAMEGATVEFLRSRGIDPTRLVPRAIDQVQNPERFHVVIFLSPAARRGFPATLRKSVFLEWFVDDPTRRTVSPDAAQEAHRHVADVLERHLRDLIGAIIGADQMKLRIEGA